MEPETSSMEVESNGEVKLPTSESNTVKCGFEIEDSGAKETDTLISRVEKGTRFGLPSWYLDSYVWNSLSTALSLSSVNCMIKLLSDKYSVFEIALVRSVLCVVIFVLISHQQQLPLFGPGEKHKLLIARGVIGACGFVSGSLATVLLPISESAFLTNVYPAVIAFVSWIFALEELNWISWTGIVGTILGNALIAHPPFIFGGHEEWGSTRLIGILMAILCNLFTSGAYFLVGKIGTSVPTTTTSFYQALCSLIISICLLGVDPEKLQIKCNAVEVALLLGVGFASLVNQLSLTRALQIGPPTKTVMLFMTSMLWSSAFGVLVLSERITWISATGSIIILTSVLAVSSQKQKSQN